MTKYPAQLVWLISLLLSLSGCKAENPVESAVISRTCSQTFGDIDFSMTASASHGKKTDCLQAVFTIPMHYFESVDDLEQMSTREILEFTGTDWNQDAYGIGDEAVSVEVNAQDVRLIFTYEQDGLESYVQYNELKNMTPADFGRWFLSTTSDQYPGVCS